MLPPPLPAPKGLQKGVDKQALKSSPVEPSKAKQQVTMPPRLLKAAARLQEMADMAKPQQAEEDRANVFMGRLPHVQAASRRLQGQLEIHGDEPWPLPPLPKDRNPFIVRINAMKIGAALEDCKDFAVTADRKSSKFEFLDVVAQSGKKRVVMGGGQDSADKFKSFGEEKNASEVEASNAIRRLRDEGLQEELKELENEGMSGKSGQAFHSDIADQTSEVPSTPKSLFHSVGPTPTPSATQISQEGSEAASEDEDLASASQGESSVDTAERERREEWEELTRDRHFRGIGPYRWPEYGDTPTPEPASQSEASGATPEWVYREDATPSPHYDSEGNSIPCNTPTASNEDQAMPTSLHETETADAASEHIPAALDCPSAELRALSVHDSETGGTQSMINGALADLNAQDKGKGREAMSDNSNHRDKSKGKEVSSSVEDVSWYASQNQQESRHKPTISDLIDAYMDDGKEHHGKTRLDVAASLRNHTVTYVDETQPDAKERNPPVPQPENMPGTLTEAICNHMPVEAKPIFALTLERVDPPVSSPTDKRCILLKHFEVGLDGVEGLCQGTTRIPETFERMAERERRVGKLGTFKQGDGGFYKSLKSAQQKEQRYGKGYWYFFGVKFKQTSKERRLRKGGKWLLFGAPIEAVYHLDLKRRQESVTILLGGGVDKSGTAIKPFEANFKRTHTLFSRGGPAPMDIWPGGEDWDDGVFKDIRAAMANNGLRVGFLHADTQTFTPRPQGFPAAGRSQAEKKRKQAGPDMTEEETKAMEKSMKPKRLSDEDIGAILAMSVINDRDKQDAAARSQ